MFNDNTQQQVGNEFAAPGGSDATSAQPANGFDNGFMPPNPSAPSSSDNNSPSSAPFQATSSTNSDNPLITPVSTSEEDSSGDDDSDELLTLKRDALQQLTPLVSHLDQAPEEKFRTLMMMIQATDDQSKLKEAYDTAKTIQDDKVRAQALLDVINEINYFTQADHAQS